MKHTEIQLKENNPHLTISNMFLRTDGQLKNAQTSQSTSKTRINLNPAAAHHNTGCACLPVTSPARDTPCTVSGVRKLGMTILPLH